MPWSGGAQHGVLNHRLMLWTDGCCIKQLIPLERMYRVDFKITYWFYLWYIFSATYNPGLKKKTTKGRYQESAAFEWLFEQAFGSVMQPNQSQPDLFLESFVTMVKPRRWVMLNEVKVLSLAFHLHGKNPFWNVFKVVISISEGWRRNAALVL